MSSKQAIALSVHVEQHELQNNDGAEHTLTINTQSVTETVTPSTDDSNKSIQTKDKQILMPGDEVMTREDVPKYPTYIYILYYIFMLGAPFILGIISYFYVVGWEEYIIAMVGGGLFVLFTGWFIGAVFHNLCGMQSNYTRKIAHMFFFLFPLIFVGGVDAWDEHSDTGIDLSAAYSHIIIDVLWAMWQSQLFVFVMARPTRTCANYICGDTKSDNPCRWINCPENTMDAFERKEDRPNHLLWLNSQGILGYLFLFGLSFWWNNLDSGVFVLIPAIIDGLGDGLAEPVGVKWGRNGCGTGKDCTYKVYGCCSKYEYTRSIPGSSMVLLAGYLGVILCWNEYTMWQFIIAMIVVPPIGCIVEAKAPHTMDNPFIISIVGVVATAILYIDL